jgi:hypothetical protein
MLKTVSSITNAIGALNYKGTWNASTNSPALASGVGTKGDYYVVSVAGSTTLNGISNWGVGDWAVFNGSVWQRVEGGADGNFENLSFNAGFGSVAPAYGCRAWCLFNGTGTPSITASANISSITDNGTGSYDLNFTNAMPDGNFAVASISDGFGVANGGAVSSSTARGNSTSKVAVLVAQQSGAPADFSFVHVAIFR